MGIIKGIHHLELFTKSLGLICELLNKSFDFQIISSTQNENVLRSGEVFIVAKNTPYSQSSQIDSVFDIALNVTSVDDVLKYADDNNIQVIKSSERISDHMGYVNIAQIKSIVGNVVHTIIDKSNYKGAFLPGYNITLSSQNTNERFVKRIDHITLVVEKNFSQPIINWYSAVFGMKRLLINRNDLLDEGFVIRHNCSGMRLKAFEYWKCDETCINNEDDTCKFIIAEELNSYVENQIGTFLKEHKSPGIQHVGFSVDDIVAAAKHGATNGAQFLNTPGRYYEIIASKPQIQESKLPFHLLEKYGILVDSESEACDVNDSEKERFLLQIFTKPIFDKNTFFIELIERQGANGFGAGNIKALWDAVDKSMICREN